MAIRQEDLLLERDAVVLRFPTRRVRSAAARRARMQARRRRTATIAAALGLIVVFLLATGPSGSSPASAPGTPRAVTVHHGDTLWSLAEAHAPEGMDLRAYVDVVSELNDLEGGLVAGTRIKLPR
jgi:hypothetical protein